MASDKGYSHGDAFDEGYLQVSDLHRIFYIQYGKRDGKPVVFLHGGPGGSGSPKANTAFFDPAVYRVVLFDQRGACRSEPATETRENTTQLLIEDIEKLRKHVGVKKWHMVFGGSWGSTLSLAYSQAHPEATGSLVLRGVFFGTKAELQLGDDCMLSKVWPEVYDRFIEYLPAEKRDDPLEAYHELIMSPDHDIAYPAAKAWNRLEMSCSNLTPKAEAEVEAMLEDERWCMSHAKMEVHYFVNGCFMGPTELRDGCEKIKHIPTRMIQGRYDLLCPPRVAWELQKRLSNSKVHWTGAGHSAFDPSTLKQLIHYTDELGKSDFHLQ